MVDYTAQDFSANEAMLNDTAQGPHDIDQGELGQDTDENDGVSSAGSDFEEAEAGEMRPSSLTAREHQGVFDSPRFLEAMRKDDLFD